VIAVPDNPSQNCIAELVVKTSEKVYLADSEVRCSCIDAIL
jgi:hypothetical protein